VFPDDRVQQIVKHNRESLALVPRWLDDQVYSSSVFKYGIPPNLRNAIDTKIDQRITYSDAIAYLSKHLSKPINYMEIGVSVGKNFFQVINFLNSSHVVGFDIEEINPVLENFLTAKEIIEKWPTDTDSKKITESSFTEYEYPSRNNKVDYLSGDVFDENAWRKLTGMKFNIIFSDALHSPEAISHEYKMLKKYDLIDTEGFILLWDDLVGPMQSAFKEIWNDISSRYNLGRKNVCRLRLNGWLNLAVHEIGIISTLPII
jgi:hypothetical protein